MLKGGILQLKPLPSIIRWFNIIPKDLIIIITDIMQVADKINLSIAIGRRGYDILSSVSHDSILAEQYKYIQTLKRRRRRPCKINKYNRDDYILCKYENRLGVGDFSLHSDTHNTESDYEQYIQPPYSLDSNY